VRHEEERRGEALAAEAHVRDPLAPFDRDEEQHVAARRDDAGRHVPAHARREPADREADRFQHAREEEVLLEAPAAAAPLDQLLVDRGVIQADGLAQEGREVLEGDRLGVQAVQIREDLERGCGRRAKADPREVRVELADSGPPVERNGPPEERSGGPSGG